MACTEIKSISLGGKIDSHLLHLLCPACSLPAWLQLGKQSVCFSAQDPGGVSSPRCCLHSARCQTGAATVTRQVPSCWTSRLDIKERWATKTIRQLTREERADSEIKSIFLHKQKTPQIEGCAADIHGSVPLKYV